MRAAPFHTDYRLTQYLSSGVMLAPMDMLTKQGYDLQFGTNVIGTSLDMLINPLQRPCRPFPFHSTALARASCCGHAYRESTRDHNIVIGQLYGYAGLQHLERQPRT